MAHSVVENGHVASAGRTILSGDAVIIDGCLTSADPAEAWNFYLRQKFWDNHVEGFTPVYRLTDGRGWSSSTTRLRYRTEPAPGAPTVSGNQGTVLGRLFGRMFADRATAGLLDRFDPWSHLDLSCSLFHHGAGLGWHADQGHAGAFIYYVHPEWQDTWGGELLLEEGGRSPAEAIGEGASHRDLYRTVSCASAPPTGLGTYVSPHPNRLVVFKAGVRHCVKKVETASGEAFRGAISGFFTSHGPDEPATDP